MRRSADEQLISRRDAFVGEKPAEQRRIALLPGGHEGRFAPVRGAAGSGQRAWPGLRLAARRGGT